MAWRAHPATIRFLGAIRALALNIPPAWLNRESIELQYGVTSGLGIAASLIDDPTSMYPELFTQTNEPTPGQAGEPDDGSYTTGPDA